MIQSPDPWQKEALSSLVTLGEDVLLCCSRQSGKTEVVSAAAYIEACMGGFVLVVGPSDRQSLEFFDRLKRRYHERLQLAAAEQPPSKHELRLANGGRVVAVPNSEGRVRVYDRVTMLVIDEASRVPDQLYGAVRPMLAVSGGKTALLSTPWGKRGFFWKEWTGHGREEWRRFQVPWASCPRIDSAFVESERRSHGDLWVQQEYECEFLEVDDEHLFDVDRVAGLIEDVEEVW